MKCSLKPGDRIRLISMTNDPDPIPEGSVGTVAAVHDHRDWLQVEIDWDNGRALMLTLPEDSIAIIQRDQHNPNS